MCKYCEIKYRNEYADFCIKKDGKGTEQGQFCIEPYTDKKHPAVLYCFFGYDDENNSWRKWVDTKIKYCPWCGRKLNKNEWEGLQ